MRLDLLYPALFALLSLLSTAEAVKKNPKDAVLLSNVKSLTLRAGAKTSHRRVAAVPQLSCKGPGCKHYTIDIMRCTNQGSDYSSEDVQWSCTANIPEEFKLGSTEVICEGYDNADDERVLKGSCGVEYRLLLTDRGEEKYGGSWWGPRPAAKSTVKEETDLGGILFGLIFICVAAWILYSIYLAYVGDPAAPRAPRRPGGGWGGGWGGGGGGGGGGPDDPFDPPPPYSGKQYSGNTRGEEGWRPGFWTGALGGAAAGYMAGNRGGRQQAPPVQRNDGWFGGGNGGSRGWGGGEAPTRSSGSSSGSGSSARYESTGFGSTTRR